MKFTLLAPVAAAAPFATTAPASAQRQAVKIEVVPVSDHVYMLVGRGGNIGMSVGDDGVFLVDDQFAPSTGPIMEAIGGVTDQPVRFVANTHWHGDHTGGNENFGGIGAIIVAHENVRERMSTEQFNEVFNRSTPPSPEDALPVITFAEEVTFHWNGDELRVSHVMNAHTDGDSILRFRDANAIHMGDTYFSDAYPFIDYGSGGSIEGMIAAADACLSLADGETKIIPGHGSLADKARLREYRAMLATVHGRMAKLIEEGKSRDEVIAAAPTADLDEKWGGSSFMGPERFVGTLYDGMTKSR